MHQQSTISSVLVNTPGSGKQPATLLVTVSVSVQMATLLVTLVDKVSGSVQSEVTASSSCPGLLLSLCCPAHSWGGWSCWSTSNIERQAWTWKQNHYCSQVSDSWWNGKPPLPRRPREAFWWALAWIRDPVGIHLIQNSGNHFLVFLQKVLLTKVCNAGGIEVWPNRGVGSKERELGSRPDRGKN